MRRALLAAAVAALAGCRSPTAPTSPSAAAAATTAATPTAPPSPEPAFSLFMPSTGRCVIRGDVLTAPSWHVGEVAGAFTFCVNKPANVTAEVATSWRRFDNFSISLGDYDAGCHEAVVYWSAYLWFDHLHLYASHGLEHGRIDCSLDWVKPRPTLGRI